MKRLVKIVVVLTIPWFLIAGIRAFQQKADPGTPQQMPEKANVIAPGNMNSRQKEHAKLYDERYQLGGRLDQPPDPKLGAKLNESEPQVFIAPGLEGLPDPSITVQSFASSLACRADLVLVGTVKDKESQLMESKAFLFTEYDVSVDDIYKNNALAPVTIGGEITVVRPGGRAEINGKILKTSDASFLPLVVGTRVLLFLKYIVKTGTYDSADDFLRKGSFQLRDNRLIALTRDPVPGFQSADPKLQTAALAEALAGISASCQKMIK